MANKPSAKRADGTSKPGSGVKVATPTKPAIAPTEKNMKGQREGQNSGG